MATALNEKTTNHSVSKLMLLLNVLSEARIPMRLQNITDATHMPQATVLRYLNSLAQDGYVFQDQISGRYALTWKTCGIGDRIRSNMNLRVISSDIINELAGKLDFGICLVIEQDMECMYLDCVYEPSSMGFSLMRIGKQSPLHATGSGKVLLTSYTPSELDAFIEKKGLCQLTDHTITTKERLIEELDLIRRRGYAVDDEECEAGLRCISVPVYGYPARPIAAISAFGSAERITESCIHETILPPLSRSASDISFRLGKS